VDNARVQLADAPRKLEPMQEISERRLPSTQTFDVALKALVANNTRTGLTTRELLASLEPLSAEGLCRAKAAQVPFG